MVAAASSSEASTSMQPPPIPLKTDPGPETFTKQKDTGGAGVTGNGAGKSSRQSFSCAECRRLKLKCSRVWPCSSCEKRGCAQICPNGEMKTGKGKRLILADTEELHQRISQLEMALAKAHAETSASPHPLLSSAYLFAPRDAPPMAKSVRKESKAGLPKMSEEDEDDMVDSAFGTLTIGTEGQARFVGSFAGSEYLRQTGESQRPSPEGSPSWGNTALETPPPSANGPFSAHDPSTTAKRNQKPIYATGGIALADSFVAGGTGGLWDIDSLRAQLPAWEAEGRELVQSYWDNVNWMYQIVPRPMFDSDYLINAYDPDSYPNAHKLACVFLVMAVGVMFDLNRAPFDPRGERLFLLGRACLNVMGLEQSSPATVQALHLCGTFILNDKHGNGAEVFWPILGAAMKVAQSLGLHRDGAAFGLSSVEVEERRLVWWEILTYDRLQAMCFGRPYAVSNRMIDTKYPGENELVADKDGYHNAKFMLMCLMEKIIDVQTQTTPVSYGSIQQLDKELVDFKKNLPETLLPNKQIQDLPLDRLIHPHLVIHRLGMRLLIAQSRLLLNRPSFARSLKDASLDPSQSKYSASFVALYESAQEIVQLVKQLVIYHPSLIARWWFFWFHAFTSAVCLSAIAIRAPTCAFAGPAFHGMTIVVDISHAAREGCRAKKGLPILIRLRRRAQDSLLAAVGNKASLPASSSLPSTTSSQGGAPPAKDEDDDLSHLAGSARLRRVGSSPPPKRASFGNTPQPIVSPRVQPIPLGSAASALTQSATATHNTYGFRSTQNTITENHASPPANRSTLHENSSPTSGISAATSATLADKTGYEGAVPPFSALLNRTQSGFTATASSDTIPGVVGAIGSPQSPGLWLATNTTLSPFGNPPVGGLTWATGETSTWSNNNSQTSDARNDSQTDTRRWEDGTDRNSLGMDVDMNMNMDMDMGIALGMDRAGYEAFEDSQQNGVNAYGQSGNGAAMEFDFDALLEGMTGFGYDGGATR